jgi:hypothetical protein
MHKKTHASLKTIKALVKKDKNLSNTRKSAIMAVRKEEVPCISCGMAKSTKKHTREVDRDVTWWSGDVSTNFPRSFSGNTNFSAVVAPDAWHYVGFGRVKDEARRYIKANRKLWEQEYGAPMEELRTDRGGEYMSKDFERWCAEVGMTRSYTAPHSSAGIAENLIGRLQRNARAMQNEAAHQGGLPLDTYDYLWDEAVHYASQVINMMPSNARVLKGKSPWEHRHKAEPPVHRLHPWGCKAIAHIESSKKFQNKGRLCMFLGLAKNYDDGYRLFDFSTRSIFHSRSVKFYDRLFFRAGERGLRPAASAMKGDNGAEADEETIAQQQMLMEDIQGQRDEQAPAARQEEEREHADADPIELKEEEEEYGEHVPVEVGSARARAQTGFFDPHLWQAQYEADQEVANVTRSRGARGPWRCESVGDSRPRLPSGMVPASYEEAMQAEDRELWRVAVEEELDSIHTAGVMRRIRRHKLPPGRKTIGCKWAFDVKKKDGKIERYKARLVAKGFLQRQGLDYTDTFAPTPALASLRLVISLALQRGFQVHHMDVKTAFLVPELPPDQRVYMEPPPGVEIPDDSCFELLKTLYGLRQSASAFNKHIDDYLRRKLFIPLAADPCVYVHYSTKGEVDCILSIHVDDILIAGGEKALKATKTLLNKEYTMKDLGVLSWYLGIKVDFSADGKSVALSQRAFSMDILRQYRMENANHKRVPAHPSPRPLSVPQKRKLKPWMQAYKYRAIVGSLQYLTLSTRPDLAFAVGFAARKTANPQIEDWHALQHLLGYLAGTVDYGLVYHKDEAEIVGYCDSDWAGDKTDRKSTSGYAFIYGGAAISWKCKKQSVVARSTAEAEIVALDLAAREALWLRRMGQEIFEHGHSPIVIHEDNEAAIAISNKSQRTERTKHIDVQFFAVCDDIANKRLRVSPVASEDNVADIFTKPLAAEKFRKFRAELGVRKCPQFD